MRRAAALIPFALTLAALAPQLSAQSNPQRCQELLRELDQLNQSIFKDQVEREGMFQRSETIEVSMRVARDHELAASKTNLVETLLTDQAADQREFHSRFKLAPALEELIKSGRTQTFWNGARAELKHRLEGLAADDARIYARIERAQNRVDALRAEQRSNCASQPTAPPASPPPVERVRNIPVLTDPLITRWLRAWYAKEHGGGPYWQAGQLTQQDFLDIKDKVERWSIYCGDSNRRPDQDITEAECSVIRARQRDIVNAKNGKWSDVNM